MPMAQKEYAQVSDIAKVNYFLKDCFQVLPEYRTQKKNERIVKSTRSIVKNDTGNDPIVSFGEEEFHYLASGFGDAGAGAEDGGGSCFVEEVVVLGGDNAAYNYHDILTAQFLELLDYLRHKSLVTGGK